MSQPASELGTIFLVARPRFCRGGSTRALLRACTSQRWLCTQQQWLVRWAEFPGSAKLMMSGRRGEVGCTVAPRRGCPGHRAEQFCGAERGVPLGRPAPAGRGEPLHRHRPSRATCDAVFKPHFLTPAEVRLWPPSWTRTRRTGCSCGSPLRRGCGPGSSPRCRRRTPTSCGGRRSSAGPCSGLVAAGPSASRSWPVQRATCRSCPRTCWLPRGPLRPARPHGSAVAGAGRRLARAGLGADLRAPELLPPELQARLHPRGAVGRALETVIRYPGVRLVAKRRRRRARQRPSEGRLASQRPARLM